LNFFSTAPVIGAIDERNINLTPSIKGKQKYYRTILLDVVKNI
jgi:hypothetical protein